MMRLFQHNDMGYLRRRVAPPRNVRKTPIGCSCEPQHIVPGAKSRRTVGNTASCCPTAAKCGMGLDIKHPCRLASTRRLPSTGLSTVAGDNPWRATIAKLEWLNACLRATRRRLSETRCRPAALSRYGQGEFSCHPIRLLCSVNCRWFDFGERRLAQQSSPCNDHNVS